MNLPLELPVGYSFGKRGRPNARLLVIELVEPCLQFVGARSTALIRRRLVVSWRMPDLRNPLIAVNGGRPATSSSPVDPMITGNNDQRARGGMVTDEFFEQFVCLAATRGEANPHPVLSSGAW